MAPDAATRNTHVDLLDNGSYSEAGLGLLAAGTGLNTANVGLSGLMQTGLPYLPWSA